MCAHKPLRSVILKCESQQNLSQLSCLEYAEVDRTLMMHDGLLQGMVQNNWARWNFNNLAPQLSLLFTYVSTGWGWKLLMLFLSHPRGMKSFINVLQSSMWMEFLIHSILFLPSFISIFLLPFFPYPSLPLSCGHFSYPLNAWFGWMSPKFPHLIM